ncbi:Cytochrome P450 [Nannocystis exedens]|uniref:Cytochrome P450 n=1 Tax=Nannocystis exedens TaxID=54 RepID=A0A1I1YTL7_9BACT|nr:cytochrome P450 [Nannocystis exedens]PCC70145.1 cytochrome P450 [Nannocystis exedens]SFE22886.1 Cytochrome P450 [Nannocystis exedens]
MSTRSALPPGSRRTLLQTYRYTRDPYDFFLKMVEEYGDPFTAHVVNGSVVMTGTPAGAQQVFSADPDTFAPFGADVSRPLLGDHSLLLLSGDRHRKERKLLMPAFHGERMRAYGETICAAAHAAAARWPRGQVFAFQDSSQWISLEVIIRAVFGVVEPARVEDVRKAILEYVEATVPSLVFFPFLQREFFGLGPWARFQRARQRIGFLIAAELGARRSRPEELGDDILSRMLAARHDDGSGMSDAEIHDELLTLLFAGHETTGIALAWSIYWLHRHRDRLEKLLAELDAAGERPEPEVLARLPYLEAVVHETLRLHPIAPDAPRMLARPLELAGYTLPAGVGVAVATGLLHVRPDLYPEPHAFRPERFLDRKYGPFEYTPFGGGHRRCLGAAFATYEMKLVLATLLRNYRLALSEPREVKPGRRNVVLGPATGVRVTYLGPRRAGDPPA